MGTVIVLLLLLVMSSCGQTKYVPIESVRVDSLVMTELIRDSVFVRDSVYVQDKGDTVYKYKDKYVYLYRVRVDTFYAERIKEVEVPYPVERKMTWWERVKLECGGWVMLLVSVVAIVVLLKWFVKRTRKE